jgi:DNA repair protein RadC
LILGHNHPSGDPSPSMERQINHPHDHGFRTSV